MSTSYDTIVVGAGHNGLIAATILAEHGLNVLVVDKNRVPGGLASGILPGPPQSTFAYAIGLFPEELARLLGIPLEGILHRPDPSWVELEGGEIVLRWWRSKSKLYTEAREAGLEGLVDLLDLADRFWKCFKAKGLYYTPDPPSPRDAAGIVDECDSEAAVFLEKQSSRILSEYLPPERWDLVLYPSMYKALGFALAYFLQGGGVWDLPIGGMGSFARLLYERALEAGVAFLLGCRVEGLLVENGRVTGLRVCGSRVTSKTVLYSGPIQGLLSIDGVEELLEEWEVRSLERASRRMSRVRRVDYLVSSRPDPPREDDWQGYPIIVSWEGGLGGDYSYPTLYGSPQPGGYHLVQASGFPGEPPESLPPGVEERDLVLWWARGPEAQEACCLNPTGHPDHLPLAEPYMMDSRPLPGWAAYRTSIEGLYHGSASSYPGGEINGVAGHNAAVRILVDMGLKPRFSLVSGRIVG